MARSSATWETKKIPGGDTSDCSAVGRIIPACSVTVDVSGVTLLHTGARGECVLCFRTISASMLNLHTYQSFQLTLSFLRDA